MPLKATFLNQKLAQYIENNFSAEDEFLTQLNVEASENGMPEICIGGAQGAFLQFLLRSTNAKFVLEIGSLAGYSAITMARALPKGGKVVCLELDQNYCDFIRRNSNKAELSDKIEVHQGDAAIFLQTYQPEFAFDFIFIDADKPSYSNYLSLCLPLLRSGGIMAGDNALAWGYVADEVPIYEPLKVAGVQRFNNAMACHPQLSSCFVPIGDGMILGLKK